MPICLCKAKTQVIKHEELPGRIELINLLKNDHMEDILLIYDKNTYIGLITNESLRACPKDIEGAIIRDKLFVEDKAFWEKANILFFNDKYKSIPVFDSQMEVLYFVKYEAKLEKAWRILNMLKKYSDEVDIKTNGIVNGHIHIKGINDLLWNLREWLISQDISVSVEGPGWRDFGINEMPCTSEDMEIVTSDCDWWDHLYSKYMNHLDEWGLLKQLLLNPYIATDDAKDKIMFYMPEYSFFVESISPLIQYYAKKGAECIVVFRYINTIIADGPKCARQMIEQIENLKSMGVLFFSGDVSGIYQNQYKILFLCSEYSGELPQELRKTAQYVVSLQTTPIYAHMYRRKEMFHKVFSEESRSQIDYLVASEYIADWICERNKCWEAKILRFGFPKLDAMYENMTHKPEIPRKWEQKIKGKRIFLFTTNVIEQVWLDYFSSGDDKIIIWRPHPSLFSDNESKKRIAELTNNYNVIIDDMLSYWSSFRISDAMISEPNSSIMVNYLYTGKPTCVYDREEIYNHSKDILDYRKELWYKSACSVFEKNDVLEFVKTVERGGEYNELETYRNQVVKNFDGKVCERIYSFFDSNDNN